MQRNLNKDDKNDHSNVDKAIEHYRDKLNKITKLHMSELQKYVTKLDSPTEYIKLMILELREDCTNVMEIESLPD